MLIFWRHDVRRLTCAKNVWQFWWQFVCSSAAASSSWVYSIITNFSTRLVHGLQVRDHVIDATRVALATDACQYKFQTMPPSPPGIEEANHRVTLPSCYSMSPQDTQFILYMKILIYNIDYFTNMMLPVTYVGLAYWSHYQAARCDWLQQNCLMNILVLAQKYDKM